MTNDTARAAFEAKFLPRGYKPGTIKYHHAWHGYVVSRAESDAIVDRLVEAARALESRMNRDAKASMENPTYEEAMEQIQAAEEYRKHSITHEDKPQKTMAEMMQNKFDEPISHRDL